MTSRAQQVLDEAEDLVGYATYLARVPVKPGQQRHASDNRVEVARALHALSLAQAGRRVALVSAGDAGVFGMAAAVFEALETRPDLQTVSVEMVPGISAVLACAARIGAPCGNDFCVLSLSDNLKPWEVIVQRVRAAAGAGFVLALYNPVSRARPWQLEAILDELRTLLPTEVPVVFARAISRNDEHIDTVSLGRARGDQADMRTLVLVGNRETRRVGDWLYTPRSIQP